MLKTLLCSSIAVVGLAAALASPASAAENKNGRASYEIVNPGQVRICWEDDFVCHLFTHANATGYGYSCDVPELNGLRDGHPFRDIIRISGSNPRAIGPFVRDLSNYGQSGSIHATFDNCMNLTAMHGSLLVAFPQQNVYDGYYYLTEIEDTDRSSGSEIQLETDFD